MESKINNILSEQEQMVIENILSIQNYYNLKDHRKLISIIVDEKQSRQLFDEKKVMISDVFDKGTDTLSQEAKIKIFSEKYTFENLCEKFRRPKSFKNNTLTAVLKKKLQKSVIESHNTRKNVWMLASGALFSMKNNKGLYEGLINYPNYPNYYERAIMLDITRTIKKSQTTQQDLKALQNLLTAFSRRNPYIGYCQGLNFIAFFLLTMQFKEEQAFWILSQITQTVIPMDYYTNMIGVACDQQIFSQILKIKKPQIAKKFDEVGLDGSVLSIQWFVCLFTSSLPFYLVKIVWDRLLVQGTQAFIKTGLIILSHFEEQILQSKQFYEIIVLVEQGSKNLQVSEQDFNRQFDKYYINPQGLKIARDLYREFHIKQKLNEKMTSKPQKQSKKIQQQCDPHWPLCVQFLAEMRNNLQFEIWTYRQQSQPKIIHDYLEQLSRARGKNKGSLFGSLVQQKVLLRQAAITPSSTCDYVIGRMEHICRKNKGNTHKMVKRDRECDRGKKNQFLSMVVEEEEDNEKKIENLKKILRLSEISPENSVEKHENLSTRIGFEKSQTIEFYSQFASNNQALIEMLTGKK